jgi:excisionase family DNA binding protein
MVKKMTEKGGSILEEQWISLNQYEKRFNLGHNTVLQMIANHEVEYIRTGTRYKIKVGSKNTVPREMFEKEQAARIKAETTLDLLKKVLEGGK